MDKAIFNSELKINLDKSYPTQSSAIFALADYLESHRACDKHQLFYLEPVNGGFSVRLRETIGNDDKEEFTHYTYAFISRDGTITDLARETI